MKKLEVNDPMTHSADLIAENIDRLKALFPEAVTEGKFDCEVLKQILGGAVDDREEKYGLTWHGKRRARQLALTPSIGTLRPDRKQSVDWDKTEHLVIEGDNLEVLKLLQKAYAGSVKLLYMDPPYNTGADFVYRDDFTDNIKRYLELTGQFEAGKPTTTNTETSGRFHTDWLNMMYPRLKLARNLLRQDGVLLVSINDVEVSRLRLMLDEVFGEENFLCQFVWNNEGNVDQQSKIKGVHEYILAFGRDVEAFPAPRVIDPNIEETSKLYNEQIENSITKNGPANPPSEVLLPVGFPAAFDEGTIAKRTDKWPHILDPLVVAAGKLTKSGRVKSGWSSRNLLELFINNGCIPILDSAGKETWFALTSTGAIYGYKRRSEWQGHVLSVIRNVGTTKQNSNMLAAWGIDFPYPKPVLLLQYLVDVFTRKDEQHVVMDPFAGSGTMGHAVLALNARDNGNRRFVLTQLPEPLEHKTPDLRTLTDVTVKRLRAAAGKLRADAPMLSGDLGFRMFRLDSSNVRAWEPDRDDLPGTLGKFVENLKSGRTEEDILYELLLKYGLDLSIRIEERSIAEKTVHSVGAGVLLACLSPRIDRAEVEPLGGGIIAWQKALGTAGETTCVFRDSAFVDDVVKTNLAAILEQSGIRNVRSI